MLLEERYRKPEFWKWVNRKIKWVYEYVTNYAPHDYDSRDNDNDANYDDSFIQLNL